MDDLSLTIFDIVQNSLRAKAREIKIAINEAKEENKLTIEIADDGTGMTKKELELAMSPFYTTKRVRKVGLGLSFFKMIVEQTEGAFNIESKKGEGTNIIASMKLNHIDRPPLGDISEMIYSIIINDTLDELIYTHIVNNKKFIFRKSDLEMDNDVLKNGTIAKEIKNYIKYHLDDLKG